MVWGSFNELKGESNSIEGDGNKVFGNSNMVITDLSGFDFFWADALIKIGIKFLRLIVSVILTFGNNIISICQNSSTNNT